LDLTFKKKEIDMKKTIAKIVVCGTLFGATMGSVFAADKVQIKFSHVVSQNTPKGQMALHFKKLLKERLGDQVEVDVFPSSQLFGDNKVLEAMLLGDVQFAAPSLSKFSRYTKNLQVYDLPFLFENMASVERFQQGFHGQQLLGSMKDKGLIGLGYLHNGMKQLSASNPLKVPADASGKKFRIMSSDVLRAQFEAVGAVPLKKPFSEVFTLLQTQAIDGQENTWSNIYSKKFFEVQPFITESNHGLVDYMVVTSADFWNGLDDNLRREIKRAMDEAILLVNQVASEKSLSDRKMIIDSGRSEVLSLTPTERQQWITAMKPVWDQFEKEIGVELINAAQAANK
jgi:C4-dicarboxylate-binding protein DctP